MTEYFGYKLQPSLAPKKQTPHQLLPKTNNLTPNGIH